MDSDTIRRERQQLRAQYGALFDRVARLLFDVDPIGINFGDNTDEYEPEVGTILPRLVDARSSTDVLTIVHEEFCRWFEPEDVGPMRDYQPIASAIWEIWQASARQPAR